MPDLIYRRDWLLAAIRAESRPVRTADAERLLAGSPWPTSGRNTCRKDLRGLARRGLLTAATDDHGRIHYGPTRINLSGDQ
jgi:hypothetical protein